MAFPGLGGIDEEIRYGFAVGRVRVLETRLFGHPTYERLLDAPDFREQKRILSDSLYGRYLADAQNASDVERGLGEALEDFYGFLETSELPPPVTRFFRTRHDYVNLKAKVKADLLGAPLEGLLVEHGSVPADAWRGAAADLPPHLRELHDRLVARPEAEGGSSAYDETRLDAEVDAAMFSALADEARDAGSGVLKELAGLLADVGNLKTLVRARNRGWNAAEVASLLVPGGSLSAADAVEIHGLPKDESAKRLSRLRAAGGLSADEVFDLQRLDVAGDNAVVKFLRGARMQPSGPEPVIAYVMGREAEVAALRTLLVGKLAGVSVDVLRLRVRDVYV